MITTRQIDADNPKKAEKLRQATTKDVDASIPRTENLNPQKSVNVSTRNIADVADIAEKKRRDEIMAEKEPFGFHEGEVVYHNGKGGLRTKAQIEKENKGFNLQYAIVEIDELLQGILRRELK